MQVGEKIHQLRKISGITQEQLAAQLSISRQTISKWEAGSSTPDIDSVVKISKLFQVSLDELLLDKTKETTKTDSLKTIEELVKINRRNRYITIAIIGVFIFLLGVILGNLFVTELRATSTRMEYSLYRQTELLEYSCAIIETNAKMPVLLVAEGTYEDRGKHVTFYCDVCYVVDNEVKKLGSIAGAGTAYPIAYDSTGIYAATGHSVYRYVIDDATGQLVLAQEITEDNLMQIGNYGNATVVNFE